MTSPLPLSSLSAPASASTTDHPPRLTNGVDNDSRTAGATAAAAAAAAAAGAALAAAAAATAPAVATARVPSSPYRKSPAVPMAAKMAPSPSDPSQVSKHRQLVKRQSTFWPDTPDLPHARGPPLIIKHPSLELLSPRHDCSSRRSSPLTAIFNLVATICGGGVLSLPIAFARAGLIPGTLLMVFSAVITDFAMYILCSCARRTGGRSYSDVARSAFGPAAEVASTVLLFLLLLFVLTAYMVLVKDIWTGVLLHLFPPLKQYFDRCNQDAALSLLSSSPSSSPSPLPHTKDAWETDTGTADRQPDIVNNNGEYDIPDGASDRVLLVILLLVSPLLFKTNLHSLRHTCYVGVVSLLVLTMAVLINAYEMNFVIRPGLFRSDINWCGNLSDVLFAFPIISLSFFSIYNVLSVHAALVNPTRSRVKSVLDGTVLLCFILFYIVAISGYLYAYDQTLDNILLNLPLSFRIVLVGRLGYGFTLMFGMPMVLLPCREALLTLPRKFQTWKQYSNSMLESKSASNVDVRDGNSKDDHDDDNDNDNDKDEEEYEASNSIAMNIINDKERQHQFVNGKNFDEERPLLRRAMSLQSYRSNQSFDRENLIPPKAVLLARLKHSAGPYEIRADGRGGDNYDDDDDNDDNDNDDDAAVAGPKHDEKDSLPVVNDKNGAVLTTSTIGLVVLTYVLGVSVPGVAVVWSICGSSMALIIGFFIPAACYLKIRTHKRLNPRSVGAWALVIFSLVASIVCTTQTILSLGD